MAAEFDWAGFRALSKRLADLLGGERDDAEFAEDVRRALSFLYTAGITMPTAGDIYEDAGGDGFWNDVPMPAIDGDDSATLALAEVLAERIAESIEAAQPDSIGDPDEITEVATTAAENLVNAQRMLAAGDEYFDANRVREAQWEWAFGFDEWGAAALAGLSALHELLWGAR